MNTPFVEEDCTIEFEGQKFTSGGAVVTPDHVVGYMTGDMKEVQTCHGEKLGPAKVTAYWKAPFNCWLTSRFYQVEATIGGIVYTGRTAGGQMLWRGKRKAKQ